MLFFIPFLMVELGFVCRAMGGTEVFSCSTSGTLDGAASSRPSSEGSPGASFRAVFELKTMAEGRIKIQDPKPLDRITNCRLKLKWLKRTSTSGASPQRWFGEFARGICNPERPFEKTALYNSVMVWLEFLPRTKRFSAKIQFVKASGVELCRISTVDEDEFLTQLSKWESALAKKAE